MWILLWCSLVLIFLKLEIVLELDYLGGSILFECAIFATR